MRGSYRLAAGIILVWAASALAGEEIGTEEIPVSLIRWNISHVEQGDVQHPSPCEDHLCTLFQLRNGSLEPLAGLLFDLRFHDRAGNLLHQEETACPIELAAGATGDLAHCWFAEDDMESADDPFDRLRSSVEKGEILLEARIKGAVYRSRPRLSAGWR